VAGDRHELTAHQVGHRQTEGQGAGRVPNVQGPQIKIEPPVTSATKITGERKID